MDIVLSWLPKSSLSDYLTPFIQCLEESSGQAGEGHVELVASMRAQVQREMENYDEGEASIRSPLHPSIKPCREFYTVL